MDPAEAHLVLPQTARVVSQGPKLGMNNDVTSNPRSYDQNISFPRI